jgi:hypothetical protein
MRESLYKPKCTPLHGHKDMLFNHKEMEMPQYKFHQQIFIQCYRQLENPLKNKLIT